MVLVQWIERPGMMLTGMVALNDASSVDRATRNDANGWGGLGNVRAYIEFEELSEEEFFS